MRPVLVYSLPRRLEKTSWRPYGGLQRPEDVDREVARIDSELGDLRAKAEFPVEFLPLLRVSSDAEAAAAVGYECDAFLLFAAGGAQGWIEAFSGSKRPTVMFVRHRSGPVYLWYEIAHYRFLRKSVDDFGEPNMDADDVVVDDHADVLWRLRALYGAKNARGTRVLAIGGLQAYSAPGQEKGPAHAKDVWGYDVKVVPDAEVTERVAKARADAGLRKAVEAEAAELLSQPGVTLETDRKFVENTFVALHVFRELMDSAGAANLGVANCMGHLIGLLDTPPCLVLSLLNDSGYTAFCHVDLTHTTPGVLLRWISGKPSFVSNGHFPHHGLITLAHCAAPRRMDGKDFEPTKIMTHFESDYGAATKVGYRRGQTTTNIVPRLDCSAWLGFRGRIVDAPSYDMCRSQMDLEIEGDWRGLLAGMHGFHTVTCYGDYLREVGYAIKKLGIGWKSYSSIA